jgi:hypothetical protein
VRRVTVYPSDFGLEQLERENVHGPPKSIWKSQNTQESSDEEEEYEKGSESEEEDEEGGSDDSDASDESDEEEVHDIGDMEKPTTKVKGADFIRSKPGLVLDLDAGSEDEEEDGERGGVYTGPRGGDAMVKKDPRKKTSSDIDAVALRAYELSKLRYYFAIAELSDTQVANHLYQQLDGMELEHSSMAMDLRFVPSDVR